MCCCSKDVANQRHRSSENVHTISLPRYFLVYIIAKNSGGKIISNQKALQFIFMRQSSKNLNEDSNPENKLERYLEQSKLKTQALKKLLKFIEDGDNSNNIPPKSKKGRN